MLGLFFRFLILLSFFHLGFAQTSGETHRLEAEQLVSKAADILPSFEADSHEWDDRILGNFKRAKAIMIVPNLYKGGLFLGGEKGSGILLVRQSDGSWSYPAFYEIYSASLGFQIGFEKSKHLLLIMNDGALQAFRKNKFDLGGEVNVAVGVAGGSAEASTTRNLGVDILSYSLSAGAYAGLNLEGGYIQQNKSRNSFYYAEESATTTQIMDGLLRNPQADRLRDLVSRYGD